MPRNIVNKLNRKAKPDNVCADCMNFNLKFSILTCDKYLIADLSLELIFLLMNSSCIFLINKLRDEYLLPKDIIINGIAGNRNAAYVSWKFSIAISITLWIEIK